MTVSLAETSAALMDAEKRYVLFVVGRLLSSDSRPGLPARRRRSKTRTNSKCLNVRIFHSSADPRIHTDRKVHLERQIQEKNSEMAALSSTITSMNETYVLT